MNDTPTHCPHCGKQWNTIQDEQDCIRYHFSFEHGLKKAGRTQECCERQIAVLEKNIDHASCDDWAEDHTHLQKLCREAGCTEYEVEGDSYGVPGIGDLADLLAKKLADERAHADRLAAACNKAREFVKSWGELNNEDWWLYRSALTHIDAALAAHEALRKP